MRKLKLELSELEVTSFETSPALDRWIASELP